ncbi:EXD1 [Lepeophtheirus salmonis]|uniref:EXD1 n=1 Tax=Lepeophtheirus salmonis TaxID=72036 RepID=A0A7R8D7J3_LEPSM|nr:EXD1 [Lepeophtheirus salmonis]CAF3027628.1 EXD1 [Lepeophtheirus salmonis]
MYLHSSRPSSFQLAGSTMDSVDYEYYRNLTLMFFLEKLFEKKPRSLHDLSCQFGTKGFSKEMRQIAGGSQSGLRKFLSQYPSLFSLEGDSVTITQATVSDKHSEPSRDYAQEAINYFKHKLRQYGVGTEVPIKSLLGHRSQAPPEVRHISGQHVKEFKDFLSKYPEEFVVKDEVIYLKEYEGNITSRYSESRKLKLIKDLFSLFRDHFPKEKWSTLFRTEQDFITFLKIYPHNFHVSPHAVHSVSPKPSPISIMKTPIPESSSLSTPPPSNNSVNYHNNLNNNQTLKQRINKVVMKMIAENTEKDKGYSHSVSNGLNDYDGRESLKYESIQKCKVVVSVRESAQLVDNFISLGKPVGFDGEGVNLGPKGQLTMVQLSNYNGEVFILDLQTCPNIMFDGKLKYLLEHESIVKVVHDCRNDSAVLLFQHGVHLKNVFDTQAAYAVLQFQETGKPVYKVKNIKNVYRRDQKYWARRPLSKDMIAYAAADVLSLVPKIYDEMNGAIRSEYRQLFSELCEEQVMLYINTDDVKIRKKQRKIENEVSDLKLKFATSDNKNIVLSNREIRLLRYLDLTKEDKEKLKGSLKVAKKLEKIEQRESRSPYDDDEENFMSLDSVESNNAESPESSLSPRDCKSPTVELKSITEAMDMVEDILADDSMDRVERIDKLERILSRAMLFSQSGGGGGDPSSSLHSNRDHYHYFPNGISSSRSPSPPPLREITLKKDVETQTLSTGDIVMTKVFTPES